MDKLRQLKDAMSFRMMLIYSTVMGFKNTFDSRGDSTLRAIIGVSVGLVVASVLLPLGINEIRRAENTDWGILNTIVVTLLPVLAVISIVMLFYRVRR